MALHTYDPEDVVIIVNGILIEGFAPDEFITVEREANSFEKTAGASGLVVRTRNRNRMGTVTLRLLSASPSNARLTAMADLDELFGTGVGEFSMRQLSSSDVVTSPNCWVEKRPPIARGTDAPIVEWVLACDQLDPRAGSATSII